MIKIETVFGQSEAELGLLGRVGEAGTRCIEVECASVLTNSPTAVITMVVQRRGDDEAQSVPLTASGTKRTAVISDWMVAVAGRVRIELRATVGETRLKTAVYYGSVERSLIGQADEHGQPVHDVLWRAEQVIASTSAAGTAAASAATSATTAAAAATAAAAFFPSGGATGKVLVKKSNTDYDTEWRNEAVSSVNGQTGAVALDAEDVGALPASTEIPSKTSDLENDSGFLTAHQSLDAYRTSADQDTIDAAQDAIIAANTAARHGHENKSILDRITAMLVDAWTAASTWVTTNGANVLAHMADVVKHITAAERSAWTAKQDAISDLNDIRIGAAAGATALQSVPDTYRTAAEQDVIDAAQDTLIADNTSAINTKLAQPTSGLAVGKYLRIASIDAAGHAVLECVDEHDDQYELIEEITLTVNTNTISRAQRPNGDYYDFKHVIITLDNPGGVGGSSGYFYIYNNLTAVTGNAIIEPIFITGAGKKHAFARFETSGLFVRATAYNWDNLYNTSNFYDVPVPRIRSGNIKSLSLTGNGAPWAAGTVIKIYGVIA